MTEEVEYRSIETELRVDLSKRKIIGLANVFGNQDAFGTVFDKGAFKKTIRDKFNGGKGKIKFLFNHDPFSMIGTLTKLKEGEEGLEFEGIVSDTPLGNEILTLVQDKALTDNSIGFRRQKTNVDENDEDHPVLHFVQVELFDVSPVTFGANDKAVITGVRYRGGLPDIDELAEAVAKRVMVVVPDLSDLLERTAQMSEDKWMLVKRPEGEENVNQTEEAHSSQEERGKVNSNDSKHTSDGKSKSEDNIDNDSDASQARLRMQKARLDVAEQETQVA
ncbi:hypothetical protein LCGC14_0648200 [marine sediment metagenome]|uniref:Prohead serine protease domain-containing protein n=1 Tax=marine sediment metagenome TaxID=412755 RepID=A0A0F9RGT8_9ZZZZ